MHHFEVKELANGTTIRLCTQCGYSSVLFHKESPLGTKVIGVFWKHIEEQDEQGKATTLLPCREEQPQEDDHPF